MFKITIKNLCSEILIDATFGNNLTINLEKNTKNLS